MASVCWLRHDKDRQTRASAEDTFDLQQVSDGVHGCVQVGANGPDLYQR